MTRKLPAEACDKLGHYWMWETGRRQGVVCVDCGTKGRIVPVTEEDE